MDARSLVSALVSHLCPGSKPGGVAERVVWARLLGLDETLTASDGPAQVHGPDAPSRAEANRLGLYSAAYALRRVAGGESGEADRLEAAGERLANLAWMSPSPDSTFDAVATDAYPFTEHQAVLSLLLAVGNVVAPPPGGDPFAGGGIQTAARTPDDGDEDAWCVNLDMDALLATGAPSLARASRPGPLPPQSSPLPPEDAETEESSDEHSIVTAIITAGASETSVALASVSPYFCEQDAGAFSATYEDYVRSLFRPRELPLAAPTLLDALFGVLIGIPSRWFVYDSAAPVLAFAASVPLRELSLSGAATAALVGDILNRGALFARLESLTGHILAAEASSGLVLSAFARAVDVYLQDYRTGVLELRRELLGGDPKGRRDATLLVLAARLRPATDTLTFVSGLCGIVPGVVTPGDTGSDHGQHMPRGARMLSLLYLTACRAVPERRLLALEFFRAAAQPYLALLSSWLYDGECVDPYGEFAFAGGVPPGEDDFWLDGVDRIGRLPNFLARWASVLERCAKCLVMIRSVNAQHYFFAEVARPTLRIVATRSDLAALRGEVEGLAGFQAGVHAALVADLEAAAAAEAMDAAARLAQLRAGTQAARERQIRVLEAERDRKTELRREQLAAIAARAVARRQAVEAEAEVDREMEAYAVAEQVRMERDFAERAAVLERHHEVLQWRVTRLARAKERTALLRVIEIEERDALAALERDGEEFRTGGVVGAVAAAPARAPGPIPNWDDDGGLSEALTAKVGTVAGAGGEVAASEMSAALSESDDGIAAGVMDGAPEPGAVEGEETGHNSVDDGPSVAPTADHLALDAPSSLAYEVDLRGFAGVRTPIVEATAFGGLEEADTPSEDSMSNGSNGIIDEVSPDSHLLGSDGSAGASAASTTHVFVGSPSPLSPLTPLPGRSFDLSTETTRHLHASLLDRDGPTLIDSDIPLDLLIEACLEPAIAAQTANVDRWSLYLLRTTLGLDAHLEAFRDIYLMAAGDVVDLFGEALFAHLAGGGQADRSLRAFFDEALQAREGDPSVSLAAEHVSLAWTLAAGEVRPGDDLAALACVELSYSAPWPLNVVLHGGAVADYNRVFCFLLQLRCCVWHLQRGWTALKAAALRRRTRSVVLRHVQATRAEMDHFLTILQGYLISQILSVSWGELSDALAGGVDSVDALIGVHAAFISRVNRRALLGTNTAAVHKIVMGIMQAVVEYNQAIPRLVAALHVRGGGGPTDAADGGDSALDAGALEAMEAVEARFRKYIDFLVLLLDKLVRRGFQPHIRDLLTRLDYNGYYRARLAAKKR